MTDTPLAEYQSLRQAKRMDLAKEIPLPGPLAIYLETTNICNFKCKFCPESFSDYEQKTGGLFKMARPDFLRIAEQVKSIGKVKTLNFYMLGEPFAHPELLDFVSIACQESLAERIIVTTNGTLLAKAGFERICKSGLDYLRVSIYGANQKAHQENTQSKIPLSRVVDNVAGLAKFKREHGYSRPLIYAKMIESISKEENDEFVNLFNGLADEVALEPVMNWNDPDEGNLSGLNSEKLMEKPNFSARKEVCPFPFYMLVIHSDLNVSVCCVDWDKKVVVGNLRDQTLAGIWHGDRLKQLQQMHLQRRRKELPGCANCTFLHTAPDNLDAYIPA